MFYVPYKSKSLHRLISENNHIEKNRSSYCKKPRRKHKSANAILQV